MRSDDLWVGMEVAVKSAQYGLGTGSIGLARAKVRELNVYEFNGKRTKTVVEILDRDTGNGSGQTYHLDGKNIVCRWSEVDAQYRQAKQQAEFQAKKLEIQRKLNEERIERSVNRVQRIAVLLSGVGVLNDMPFISRHSPRIVLGTDADLDKLEALLTEAIRNRHQKGT